MIRLAIVKLLRKKVSLQGQIWAPNFVPRVMWGSRDPVAVDNFPLPAEVGVIGHHTHWDECFTLQDCIKVKDS